MKRTYASGAEKRQPKGTSFFGPASVELALTLRPVTCMSLVLKRGAHRYDTQ